MELRPYQVQAKTAIYSAWSSGAKNVLIQLHTGAGKTVLFSNIIAENPGMSIAIAHRVELVSQISLTLARYGVRHNIIAQKAAIRNIVAIHMQELNQSFFNVHASCIVAAVDTLVRMDAANNSWMKKVTLVVQDEGHHPLKHNKWGKAAELFPNARGLYPTATPIRADGCGLGRQADGIMDALVVGPPMQILIEQGFLTKYVIFAPPSTLDLSEVTISASGDYSPPKLRTAVHKSSITGDVVKHYLKIARGKLGVTFAVDIEAATEIAQQFREAGVPAEIISSKTPDLLRASIMRRFRNREILQLVNVDLLGEGVDVPAIEVVSMARPTQSFALYSQQLGRALRPMKNKPHAIIIDHAGNVARHGLPDEIRNWTLSKRDRRNKSVDKTIPLKTCLKCFLVYQRFARQCPHCGYYTPPAERSAPHYVDGDLIELSPEVLAALRKEIKRIDDTPKIPQHLPPIAQIAVHNKHIERQQSQAVLRDGIALWAGYHKLLNRDDSEIYKRFYFQFDIDVATAQTLGKKEAEELTEKINRDLINIGVKIA